MVGTSYIRIIYNPETNEEGRKLYVNIEPLDRSKGVPTADIPIPTLEAENRILIPTGGLVDDFNLNCVLHEEDTKVAANISASGTETDRTDVRTIQEQWDFIFDEIIKPGVFAIFELYVHWNDTTYRGWLQVQSPINNETYTGEVAVRLIFKVGKNPLNLLT